MDNARELREPDPLNITLLYKWRQFIRQRHHRRSSHFYRPMLLGHRRHLRVNRHPSV